jgi:hypothetical protein
MPGFVGIAYAIRAIMIDYPMEVRIRNADYHMGKKGMGANGFFEKFAGRYLSLKRGGATVFS